MSRRVASPKRRRTKSRATSFQSPSKDPNAADFTVPEFTLQSDVSIERVARRGELLASFNGGFDARENRAAFDTMGRYQQRALDVLTGERVRGAFRLDQ